MTYKGKKNSLCLLEGKYVNPLQTKNGRNFPCCYSKSRNQLNNINYIKIHLKNTTDKAKSKLRTGKKCNLCKILHFCTAKVEEFKKGQQPIGNYMSRQLSGEELPMTPESLEGCLALSGEKLELELYLWMSSFLVLSGKPKILIVFH